MKLLTGVAAFALLCASCGNTHFCFFTSLNVAPPNVTITVGNSQTFLAFGNVESGCAAIQSNLSNVTWEVSNSNDASLVVNQGTATVTCINAATITLTSTLPSDANNGHAITDSATLICN